MIADDLAVDPHTGFPACGPVTGAIVRAHTDADLMPIMERLGLADFVSAHRQGGLVGLWSTVGYTQPRVYLTEPEWAEIERRSPVWSEYLIHYWWDWVFAELVTELGPEVAGPKPDFERVCVCDVLHGQAPCRKWIWSMRQETREDHWWGARRRTDWAPVPPLVLPPS